MNWSESLKVYRHAHGLRQSDMAAMIGISRAYYIQVEHGREPGTQAESKISEFFKNGGAQ